MTWPFENNTNGIVKNLAKRNLKSEKRRNVMVIVSVVLSAFLISLSGLTGVSLMQTEKKKVIDTYEATYVQVDETHIEELREVPEFARVGEYYRYGEEVSAQGFKGFFAYTDKETLYMARSQMNLADGDLPEEKNEIAVSKEWLSKFFLGYGKFFSLIYYFRHLRYNRAREAKYVLFSDLQRNAKAVYEV